MLVPLQLRRRELRLLQLRSFTQAVPELTTEIETPSTFKINLRQVQAASTFWRAEVAANECSPVSVVVMKYNT